MVRRARGVPGSGVVLVVRVTGSGCIVVARGCVVRLCPGGGGTLLARSAGSLVVEREVAVGEAETAVLACCVGGG